MRFIGGEAARQIKSDTQATAWIPDPGGGDEPPTCFTCAGVREIYSIYRLHLPSVCSLSRHVCSPNLDSGERVLETVKLRHL